MNYQKEMEKIIKSVKTWNKKPSLLLHACCAPCSSYCLEILVKYFDITVLFYNPNISCFEEYNKRANELERFIKECSNISNVKLEIAEYIKEPFYEVAKGFENDVEGGERCFRCYELRLRKAASYASENDFDFFTTTLSISPHKNAEKINEIGKKLSLEYNISYLYSDFKKNNGFKRSIELSKEYNLYRQNFCGCIYSKRDLSEE